MPENNEASPEGKEPVVVDNNIAPEGEQKNSPEGKEGKEAPVVESPTVPLSDFHSLKDTFSRLVGNDPEKLKEIAETDPKLAQSIKDALPNRFKDVDLSTTVAPADVDAKVEQAVEKALSGVDNRNSLASIQTQLGMTDIEFGDIKGKLDAGAKTLEKSEQASDYKEGLALTLQTKYPKLAAEVAANAAIKTAQERMDASQGGSAAGKQEEADSAEKAMEAKFDKNLPPGFSASAKK